MSAQAQYPDIWVTADDGTRRHVSDWMTDLTDKRSVRSAGAKGDGETDNTRALISAFSSGGEWYVPEGDYLIAAAGPNAGGVEVALTKSTRIVCHPKARFFTDGLDNDLIRFTVPGLTADKVAFEWVGGIFDQRQQKGSLVMPFTPEFPPVNPGQSNTCDGLSIRGFYTSGAVKIGIATISVTDATFLAGDHWQTAGGDSGLYIEGGDYVTVARNTFKGNRDTGFYGSAHDPSGLSGRFSVYDNLFLSCFHGCAIKRSAVGAFITNNHFENCVRAAQYEHLVGPGGSFSSITDNLMVSCHVGVRMQNVSDCVVQNNKMGTSGALLADGVTAFQTFVPRGILLEGCRRCEVTANRAIGMQAATAAYTTDRVFLDLAPYSFNSTAYTCDDNTVVNNRCDNWRSIGFETGNRNQVAGNVATNATNATMTMSGTGSVEARVDTTTALPIYMNGMLFGDGSATAAMIGRRSQTNTGLFFGTNKVGVTVAGTERMAATNRGVSAIGLPTATTGLSAGDLWVDTADGNTVKRV